MVWKILSALSAVCLGTACYFAMANQKLLVEERNREKQATANLAEVRTHIGQAEEAKKTRETKLAEVNKELETTKTSLADIGIKVQAAEQDLAGIKINLEQTTKIVTQNQKQIDDAGDIKALIAQSETYTKERAEAESALANQAARLVAAQERVTSLTNAAKEAEERESRGRRGIVDDDFTAKVAHSYTDWGFVVLNKGNGGGVFANADLEVKRGKEVVAKLKVRDVEQNSSVADLVKGSLAEGEHIRPGDMVVAAAEQSAKTPKPSGTAAPAASGAPAAPGDAPAAAPGAPAMGSDPFGAPAAAPAPGAAPAAPAMGSDPFGAPAAPAPAAPAAPAAGADPFGAPAAPATPPATPPAGGATPPSTADPFGAAPPPAK